MEKVDNFIKRGFESLSRKLKLTYFFVIMICFFGSIGRVILLLGDELYKWSDKPKLIVVDILSCIIGIYFAIKLQKGIKSYTNKRYFIIDYLSGVIICGGDFAYQYITYKNFNSAIYHMIVPNSLVSIGLIFFAVIFVSHLNEYIGIFTKRKFGIIASVSMVFDFTVIIYPFLETYMSNVSEFSFSVTDIIIPLLLLGCVYTFGIRQGLTHKSG